jgi:hypothetical protein
MWIAYMEILTLPKRTVFRYNKPFVQKILIALRTLNIWFPYYSIDQNLYIKLYCTYQQILMVKAHIEPVILLGVFCFNESTMPNG